MKRNTLEYEQALDAMVRILRARAAAGAEPLTYGRLSAALNLQGHDVPAHRGPMPYLLEDASLRESPDGSVPMLSALVVLQDTRWPSGGFFQLARRAPFSRPGDDPELWTRELADLTEHYSAR
ncbi:hypothetical protein [Streptomyces sp. NRRL S-4]|uniref:hypothetical protein n=1 Tax=Streptomyces sp. NRRL S-4 TaxID=1519471 RepID=UPI0006B597B7|nr:hypothetical protein [Streptomyces sp. NRRL S-4]KPC78710.1 hypothetical protein ADK82_28495 [Streptomyces sp. NRRL S-4]